MTPATHPAIHTRHVHGTHCAHRHKQQWHVGNTWRRQHATGSIAHPFPHHTPGNHATITPNCFCRQDPQNRQNRQARQARQDRQHLRQDRQKNSTHSNIATPPLPPNLSAFYPQWQYRQEIGNDSGNDSDTSAASHSALASPYLSPRSGTLRRAAPSGAIEIAGPHPGKHFGNTIGNISNQTFRHGGSPCIPSPAPGGGVGRAPRRWLPTLHRSPRTSQ